MKVYLSSTYQDLVEQRAAAQGAILQAGHHPIGMEQDVASERRPLKVCLEQLRQCQLYVCVLAWRYGYIEPEHGRSMTELEYLEAGKQGITRLMFLLRDDAPWSPKWVERTPELLRFRKQVERSHYRREFSTTDELAREIVAAVSKHVADRATQFEQQESQLAKRRLPERSLVDDEIIQKLPYLADRSKQDDKLKLALAKPTRRPQLFVVHGKDKDCVTEYLERIIEDPLLKLLGQVESFEYEIPDSNYDDEEYAELINLNISLATSIEPPAKNPEELRDGLSVYGNVMLQSILLSSDLWNSCDQAVYKFAGYWQRWPDLKPGQRMLVFLGVKYAQPPQSRSFIERFLRHRGGREASMDASIRACLSSLGETNELCQVLPQLGCIDPGDCEKWLRRAEVRDLIAVANRLTLGKTIRAFFASRDDAKQTPCLPMEDLVPQMVEWLRSFRQGASG